MQTRLSFYLPNGLSTQINTIDAGNYNGITAGALVQVDGKYEIETWGGDEFLCFTGDAEMVSLLNGNIQAKAHTLVVDLTVNAYVGGHPPCVPKPTK